MKRKLCLMLAALLVLLCPLSAFAAREYTLPEKMRQQLQLSSLNGSAKLLAEGDGEWVKALEPFTNQLINFYYTEAENEMGIELYAKPEEDAKLGRTVVYSNGEDLLLKSDLLIDTVLRMPVRGDWFSTLTRSADTQNPAFYSILAALLSDGGDWSAETAELRAALEFWLDGYASLPETTSVGGETRMEILYTIPAEEIRAEMKALLPLVFANEALLGKLRAAMSEEQAAVYLSPDLQWYYARLIDGLQLTEPVTMRRSFNTMGETRETELHLPVTGFDDWSALTVLSSDAGTTYELTSELRRMSLTLLEQLSTENNGHWRGVFQLERPEEQAWDVAFDIVSLRTTTTDEEKVDHEITTWTIQLAPAEDAESLNALVFDPAQIRLRLHYHSKGSVTNSTTLDVTWDATLPGGHTNGAMKLRTVYPVEIEKIDGANAIDLSALQPEKRQEYLQDFLTNARLMLQQLSQPAEAAAEETAQPDEAETFPALIVPVEDAPASEEPEAAESAAQAESGSEDAAPVDPVEEAEEAEDAEEAGEASAESEDLSIPLGSPNASESAGEEAEDADASAPDGTAEAPAEDAPPILIEEEVMLDDDSEGV